MLESGLSLDEVHLTPTLSLHESGAAFIEFAEASAFGNLLQLVPEPLRPSLHDDLLAAFDCLRGPEGVVVHGWDCQLLASRR